MPTPDELRDEAEQAETQGTDKAEDLREAADAQEQSDRKQEEAREHDGNDG